MDRTGEVAAFAKAPAKAAAPKKAPGFKAALVAAQAAARPNVAAARPSAPATRTTPPTSLATSPPVADAAFRQRIAAAETNATPTRPGYGARNASSGALGRYQLMPVALRDLGWQDSAGAWTAVAARHGVATETDFLANPAAQEAAMDTYLQRATQLLTRNGALEHAGAAVAGIEGGTVAVSEAGLLAAAHRRGAATVTRYLAHRTETPAAPLSANDQRAFAQVEKRLRDFADLPLPQIARVGGRGRNAV